MEDIQWAQTVAVAVTIFVISTGVLQTLVYLVFLAVAGIALARRIPDGRSPSLWDRAANIAPSVAIIAPAFNEGATVVESLRSLLSVEYPRLQVILVNDGSNDDTLSAVVAAFEMGRSSWPEQPALAHEPIRGVYTSEKEPLLLVLDKENGGKADAINCGINFARSSLVAVIDSDSLLERDALLRSVVPFLDNPETVAVAGTIRIANGCEVTSGHITKNDLPSEILPLFQTVEYLRAFLMARLALSKLGLLTMISGAFGIFRRDIVVAVEGFSTDTVGEDFELVMKMHRYLRERGERYEMAYLPEPVCWTEVPASLRVLARQRQRWQQGALETFAKHKDMLFRKRYGRIGFFALPQAFLFDVAGPLAEVIGYVLVPMFYLLGLLSFDYFIAFFGLTISMGISISVGALVLEEIQLKRFPKPRHLITLLFVAILENSGYRQLNNFWRLAGFWRHWTGKTNWGVMPRSGFRAGGGT